MHLLNIELLGNPKITLNGKPVETDRHKATGLLAYLATEATPQRRDVLAALLWPDYPKASAFSYLRRTLWELNQILSKGWIESDRELVRLIFMPGLSVDVDLFLRHLATNENLVKELTEAISLYRGDFLDGFVIADTAPFEQWQLQRVEFFKREYAGALEKLVGEYHRNGEYQLAMPIAQQWLALDQLNEAAYQAVMRQFSGMNDRSGAIGVYQTCVQILERELGVAPQEETERLYQAILHGEKIKDERIILENRPPSMAAKWSGNLPTPTTPFIGREAEIKQATNLLLDPNVRLLTLTGPGGTGKTRLSIQVAESVRWSFAESAWFIPLATVESVQGVVLAIAKIMNYSFYKGEEPPHQQLLNYLRDKRSLLVLDNFEQLMEGGNELILDILQAAPNVKLMVTSRQRLNLQTEQVFWVPGMRIPDEQTANTWDKPQEQSKAYSAIQLLVERAQRVNPTFQLKKENLSAVIQICRLVDGSPLGIELATAWLQLLTPEEIVKEISHSLDFLTSSAADIPDRQRSMRAVFNTSWNLLSHGEQQAFMRLCIFSGSFSREAAQYVSGARLPILLGLVTKSWLQQGENERFQLHEVMRQYGIEYLEADQNEWQQTRDRQAEFFSNFMDGYGKKLRTSDQIQSLEALEIELESNIPQAWAWLVISYRIDTLIEKMLLGLYHYWLIRSNSIDFITMLKQARKSIPDSVEIDVTLLKTILEIVETSLEMSMAIYDDHPKERMEELWEKVDKPDLKHRLGFWYFISIVSYGSTLNFEEGARRFTRDMVIFEKTNDRWELGYIYLIAALFSDISQIEKRKAHLYRALSIFREIGVVQEQGIVLRVLGEAAANSMDFNEAIDLSLKALDLFEQVGDDIGIHVTWNNLAEYYIYSGKIDEGFHAYRKIRNYHEKNGNRRMLGITLSWEGLAVSRYGNLDEALEIRKRSREVAMEVGSVSDIAWHTWELGEIYRLMGDVDQARKYYEEALPTFEKIQEYLGLGFYHRGCGDIAMMLGNWEEARKEFQDALWSQEQEKRYTRNWGLTYYHAKLGMALIHLGDTGAAKEQMQLSLFLAGKWPYTDLKTMALAAAAMLLGATGYPARAIEIAAFVMGYPTTWNEVRKLTQVIIIEARKALPVDETLSAEERSKGMEIDLLIRQLLEKELE